ncbi:hypothetical protein [Nocardioides sp.]
MLDADADADPFVGAGAASPVRSPLLQALAVLSRTTLSADTAA